MNPQIYYIIFIVLVLVFGPLKMISFGKPKDCNCGGTKKGEDDAEEVIRKHLDLPEVPTGYKPGKWSSRSTGGK